MLNAITVVFIKSSAVGPFHIHISVSNPKIFEMRVEKILLFLVVIKFLLSIGYMFHKDTEKQSQRVPILWLLLIWFLLVLPMYSDFCSLLSSCHRGKQFNFVHGAVGHIHVL